MFFTKKIFKVSRWQEFIMWDRFQVPVAVGNMFSKGGAHSYVSRQEQ